MRLRPSGRQGPVATSVAGFDSYQRDEAWTWEHMALTRARVVAGPESLAAEIEAYPLRGDRRKGRARSRPDRGGRDARAAGRSGARRVATWAVKDGPGGMQEIELLGQAVALASGCAARGTAEQLDARPVCWAGSARMASRGASGACAVQPGAGGGAPSFGRGARSGGRRRGRSGISGADRGRRRMPMRWPCSWTRPAQRRLAVVDAVFGPVSEQDSP